jgi:hypothetical protein
VAVRAPRGRVERHEGACQRHDTGNVFHEILVNTVYTV